MYYEYLDNIENEEYKKLYTKKEIEILGEKLNQISIDIEEIEDPEDIDKIKKHIEYFHINEKIKQERETQIKTINYKNKKINEIIDKNIENTLMSDIIQEYNSFLENNDIYNIENINENINFIDEKMKNIYEIKKNIETESK